MTEIGHKGIQVAVAVHISQHDPHAASAAQTLATIGEGAWRSSLCSAIVQPHLVGPIVGHKDIQVAIAIHIPKRHAVAVRTAQALTTIAERTWRSALGTTVIQPYSVSLPIVGDNRIQIAIAVHIAQRQSMAVCAAQTLPTVAKSALRSSLNAAIVTPYFVGPTIGHKGVQVAIAVHVSQCHTPIIGTAQALLAVHKSTADGGRRGRCRRHRRTGRRG